MAENPYYRVRNDTGGGILLPIIMMTGQMNDPVNRQMIGILRQIRMGPYEAGRKLIRDGIGTVQAIAVNGSMVASSGLYLDQSV